jgi:hypothetical protein
MSNVHLPENPALLMSVAVHPAVWTEWRSDGAVFQVRVSEAGKTTTVFSKMLNPVHVSLDRRWNDVVIDLQAFGGKTVDVLFDALPGPAGDDYADWCLWGEPRVVGR